jgi:protocatechuate 3,4-dioxygenase beta subunit
MNASFRKLFKPVAFFIVLQLILIGTAAAQNRDRIVRGIVKDSQGQPVQDASIQIWRTDGGLTKSAKTDKKGQFGFILGNSAAGVYHVGARKDGFKPEYQTNVKPEMDAEPPYIEFKLTPGKDEKWFWLFTQDEIITKQNAEKRLRERIIAKGTTTAIYDKGVKAYQDGNYDEAIKHLTEASAQKSDQAYIWFYLGLSRAKKDLYTEALTAYNKAIDCDPNNPDFIVQMAEALLKMDKQDEAIQAFQKAAELAEKQDIKIAARSYTNQCIILRDNNKFDKAIEACKHAIAINPKFSEAHYYLALALANNQETICEAVNELNIYIKIGEVPTFKATAKLMLEDPAFKDAKCPN